MAHLENGGNVFSGLSLQKRARQRATFDFDFREVSTTLPPPPLRLLPHETSIGWLKYDPSWRSIYATRIDEPSPCFCHRYALTQLKFQSVNFVNFIPSKKRSKKQTSLIQPYTACVHGQRAANAVHQRVDERHFGLRTGPFCV